jgi:hypothetical protein
MTSSICHTLYAYECRLGWYCLVCPAFLLLLLHLVFIVSTDYHRYLSNLTGPVVIGFPLGTCLMVL